MTVRILSATSSSDSEANNAAILEAQTLLTAGNIVAIPTETVYGLAANALDSEAVGRIYAAKGRPATNPLIVHVESIKQAAGLTTHWTEDAQRLAEAFWPGPLTLILKKNPAIVPDITTAGGNTVAIRCPNHPVALAIIKKCGFPLAAPSANKSNALSPTLASHVKLSLGDRIPLIIDGGPCSGGIESTVLDLSGTAAAVLRPGSISVLELSFILQKPVISPKQVAEAGIEREKLRSPGQLPVHYSPTTPLFLAPAGRLMAAKSELTGKFTKIAVMCLESNAAESCNLLLPAEPNGYANRIYAALHEVDAQKYDCILLEMPPETDAWQAIYDRLTRAGRWVTI